jgi:hypothetical protein
MLTNELPWLQHIWKHVIGVKSKPGRAFILLSIFDATCCRTRSNCRNGRFHFFSADKIATDSPSFALGMLRSTTRGGSSHISLVRAFSRTVPSLSLAKSVMGKYHSPPFTQKEKSVHSLYHLNGHP